MAIRKKTDDAPAPEPEAPAEPDTAAEPAADEQSDAPVDEGKADDDAPASDPEPAPEISADAEPSIDPNAELEDRDHRKGCPATRIEAYPATAPDGAEVIVSHCINCGATVSRPA